MNEEINRELSEWGSSLAGHKVAVPFAVPEGYFGHPADMAVEIMGTHTAEAVIPASQQPYSVPKGYFDALPGKVLQRADSDKQRGGTFSFVQLRWAAAAIVLLVAGVGIWAALNKGVAAPATTLLADVGDRDIKEYLVQSGTVAEMDMNTAIAAEKVNVDARDIIIYLDETGWELN